jgi:hypothetical protein
VSEEGLLIIERKEMATKFMKDLFTSKKGVTLVHLFNEVWRTGKLIEKKGKPAHLVIYDPHDKQYDVYGEDAKNLMSINHHENRGQWRVDPAKVKIYILSSILDKRENWSFDLSTPPIPNSMIKVIYDNGTIKIIKSTDKWEQEWIVKKIVLNNGATINSAPQAIYPVAYKIHQ